MSRKKVIYIGLMLIIMIFAGITYYSYGFMVKDFEYHGKINIIAGTIDYKLVSSELNSSNITTLYTVFYSNSNYSKYWDKYSSTSWVHWNKRILGDATGELGSFIYTEDLDKTGNNYNKRPKSAWYHDYAGFAYSFRKIKK